MHLRSSKKYNYEVYYAEDEERRDHNLTLEAYAIGDVKEFDKHAAGTWVVVEERPGA